MVSAVGGTGKGYSLSFREEISLLKKSLWDRLVS